MKKFQMFSVLAAVTALTGAALAHGPGGGRMFGHLDGNNDGKITLAELQAQTSTWFTRLDKNNDKTITKEELQAAHGEHGPRGDHDCHKG